MISSKMLLWIVWTVAFMETCSAAPEKGNIFVFGDYIYFGDTEETRSRAEAAAYCLKHGGELAKVWNRNLYQGIIHFEATTQGSYWIDGIDRADEFRFDRICPHGGEELDFTGIPTQIPNTSCLSLVKGTGSINSKIEAVDCSEERFVICQTSVKGCKISEPSTGTLTWVRR